MSRVCICIGVDNVRNTAVLPPLRAAADGALRFAEWASKQLFETYDLTDKDGPLLVKAVRDQIKKTIEKGTCTQLVIYFAGHGLLRTWDTEVWLLSDAADDPNEAVNLAGSISLARNSGIPHVVFVSDACRSLSADPRLTQVVGSIIFPIQPVVSPRPEVDTFYATLPANSSYELPPADAVKVYRGIFTECLLNGLAGPTADICEMIDEGGQRVCVVSSRTLKPWIEQELPRAISAVSLSLAQVPELRVESQRPKYLAKVTHMLAKSPEDLTPNIRRPSFAAETLRTMAEIHDFGTYFAPEIETRSERLSQQVESTAFDAEMHSILESAGRESFETRTGFTFIGAQVEFASLAGLPGACDIFEERGAIHVRVHSDQKPGSVALGFSGGAGTCLAAVPGFIGTVVVENGRVVNVNYTPSRNTNQWYEYKQNRLEVERRRAFVATAARWGIFRIQRGQEEAFSQYLREFKYLDPTLGIYAAYGFHQGGLLDKVQSVFDWMKTETPAIPFDVALLAGKLDGSSLKNGSVVPIAPMLSQGWALLHEGLDAPAWLFEVARYTLPALWTTLSPDGMRLFMEKLHGDG